MRCWRVGPPVLVVLVIFGIRRFLANPSGGSWVPLPVFPRWGLSLWSVSGSSPFVAEGWVVVFVGSVGGFPAPCVFVPRANACGARCVVRWCFRVFCVCVAPVLVLVWVWCGCDLRVRWWVYTCACCVSAVGLRVPVPASPG